MKTMRVSNKCYNRELRSIELARRMLSLEARTQTICAWTGLTGDRVRNLSRVLGLDGVGRGAPRQRGPSPSKFALLMATPGVREEAPAIAGLCRCYDVIPAERCPDARKRLPGIERGERLCDALELFRQMVPDTRITLEQVVLLVFTLAEGEGWTLGVCASCHCLILIDRLALSRRLCEYCEPGAGAGWFEVQEPMLTLEREHTHASFFQQTLI
jgi:hypothetical protein